MISLLAIIVGCPLAAGYWLQESYVSGDSADLWDFWTADDPSKGHVRYVDRATAISGELFKASEDHLYVGVDVSAPSSAAVNRRSVRVQSKAVYNSGLFILDVEHMPTGCGTWSALWLYGEDPQHPWPLWGEYDILEVLHRSSSITTSLHTGRDCDQEGVRQGLDFSQSWKPGESSAHANQCDVHAPGQFENQGCSQRGPAGSAGDAFNGIGGGMFAGEWDPEAGHIRTWFWRHGTAPEDILVGRPNPASWGKPDSYYTLDPRMCDPRHFQDMRLVLNINLCGDLGNAYWQDMCPMEAKAGTCEDFISDPGHMAEAYWSLRRFDVYVKDSSFVNFADRSHVLTNLGRGGWVWLALLVMFGGCAGVAMGMFGLASRPYRQHQYMGSPLPTSDSFGVHSRPLSRVPSGMEAGMYHPHQHVDPSFQSFNAYDPVAAQRSRSRTLSSGGESGIAMNAMPTRTASYSGGSFAEWARPQLGVL